MTETKPKTSVQGAFKILTEQIDKYDAWDAVIPILLETSSGHTLLEEYHNDESISDEAKIGVYRQMVTATLKWGAQKGKMPADVAKKILGGSPAPAAAPTGGDSLALFNELCKLIKAVGGDAQKRVAAHIRAVTGKTIGVAVYHNDKTIPDADKCALYKECITALGHGDLSMLKGKTGAGDKRAEPDNSAAAPAPNNGDDGITVAKTLSAVNPTEESTPEMDESQDPIEAALLALRKAKQAPKFDESALLAKVERIVETRIGKLAIPGATEIKDVLSEAMNNGGFPAKRVEELVENRLKAFKPTIDPAEVQKVADGILHGSVAEIIKRGPVAIAKPVKTDDGDLASYIPKSDPTYIVSPEIKTLLGYVKDRSAKSPVNVMTVGPHGCGKTTLAEIFAAEYKMPLLIMDCANIREKRDWFGYKYTEGGSVLWHRSQFDRCLTAGGHVIVLDELPRTTDEIRNTLFPLLDYRRRTFLEERGDYIEVGPNTVIFVTANEGMAYTGCSTLDLALDDRLGLRVEVNYLSESDEANVLVKRTGIDRDSAKKLAQIAKTIREKAIGMGATLTKTVSTRRLIEAAEAYKSIGLDGLTFALTNHFTAEGGTSSERAQVLLMVQGKFKA